MYKLLLSWRYLRTRYIALASIISVTLGVTTLIIVNAVMAGFTAEMNKRLHGILSDLVFESHSVNGFPDPEHKIAMIRQVLGDDLEGVTATVTIPAMMNFRFRGQWITRQVNVIGVDAETYAQVSDFGQYLLHPENRRRLSFALREDGYDERIGPAGWSYRRRAVTEARETERILRQRPVGEPSTSLDGRPDGPTDPFNRGGPPSDPFAGESAEPDPSQVFDEAREQHHGIILGIAIASVRQRDAEGEVRDVFLVRPGDNVQLTIPTTGRPPRAESANFTIVDLYESKMSEYDSSIAFVPLEKLQDMRGMIDPISGLCSVSSIQMRLRAGADLNQARDRLRAAFPSVTYRVQSWRELQGPLLSAVQMETMILNILLFLIIAVAGFGILATFFMIVVEKTRDIGILKSLGAPSGGVMTIFLGYGLSLGIVGSGAGIVIGVVFVIYINDIKNWLEHRFGMEVFDQTVYYFSQIPTILNPGTIALVGIGATAIAVLASILPAIRAARLHPVEALRYE